MEQYQELTHYGILGQKWGIRRYQNPDGTLTPAGKKHYEYQNPDGSLTDKGKKEYMKGAKKGKIDYKKLSDADLNMINSRFARENQFKQNVENYRKSTFKYKAKEALIARIRGKGNNGGGGGGKKGGGLGIGKLLAMPIKSAFEDAFKPVSNNGGKDNGGEDESSYNGVSYPRYKKNGHRFIENYKFSKDDKHNAKLAAKGKRFIDTSGTNWSSDGEKRNSGSRSSEDIMRERYRSSHPKKPPKPADTRSKVHKELDKQRSYEERAAKSGLQIAWHSDIHYAIRRINSDELMHYGIQGQKWGVRRFENADGTLTAEGKERYGSYKKAAKEYDRGVKKGMYDDDPELRELYIMEQREKPDTLTRTKDYDAMSSSEKKKFGNSVLKELSDIDDWYLKPENFSNDTDEGKAKWKEMQDRQEKLNDWVFDQAISKSGSFWNGKSVSEGHKAVSKEIHDARQAGEKRFKELMAEHPKEYGTAKILPIIRNDKTLNAIKEREATAKEKLVSTVLRDIGFEDTKENRKEFYKYCFD